MKVIAQRFVIEDESGNKALGKTISIRDSMSGHAYVLDQYPKRDKITGGAGWVVTEKYGDFLGKFRTKKSAIEHLKKLNKLKL